MVNGRHDRRCGHSSHLSCWPVGWIAVKSHVRTHTPTSPRLLLLCKGKEEKIRCFIFAEDKKRIEDPVGEDLLIQNSLSSLSLSLFSLASVDPLILWWCGFLWAASNGRNSRRRQARGGGGGGGEKELLCEFNCITHRVNLLSFSLIPFPCAWFWPAVENALEHASHFARFRLGLLSFLFSSLLRADTRLPYASRETVAWKDEHAKRLNHSNVLQ